MNRLRVSVLAGLLLGTLQAHAQVPAPFVGQWTVKWQAESAAQEAKLSLTASGGTWQSMARARTNPCVGREVPVVFVASKSEDDVELKLDFESVITGCQSASVTLRRIDDKTMVGKRGAADLALSRN